jgi:hypothetical protein
VRIRVRNPWVFLRLRLLGWNVRFNGWPPRAVGALQARGRGPRDGVGGVYRCRSRHPQRTRELGARSSHMRAARAIEPLARACARRYLPPAPSSIRSRCGSLPRRGFGPVRPVSPRGRPQAALRVLHTCGRACGKLRPGGGGAGG